MVKIYTEGHDTVHHPSHYTTQALSCPVECQDIRRHLPQAVADAFKYVWRCGSKGTPEDAKTDIRKAIWYLDDFLEHFTVSQFDFTTAKAVFDLVDTSMLTWRAEVLTYLAHGKVNEAREVQRVPHVFHMLTSTQRTPWRVSAIEQESELLGHLNG